tara:strand:+ start:161 stop:754 length:594 start_codon:yes stop_codon:yes gene_type:complete
MIKLGITGGIASGKTLCSNFFEERGAYIFNADKESKKHLKSSITLQKKISDIFGKKILQENKINFNQLADIAFSNKVNNSILNGIMWPEVYLIINNTYNKIKNKKKYNMFIVDAALIFEANYTSFFDYTLLITAPEKIRLDRAVNRRNISLENIQNRISLQMSENSKKKLADHVIINDSSIESLNKKLEKFYKNLFN